ncbi:hypothetical protein M422DRAFT_32983 [Sphaerobolus stellatus SS14]|uniref:GDP/GTP exchange factor Sec2 N-terminal domain-containing protein n=1 Tax=Sphaerobolus stellatus (strain SS14) TaxID=990650 RepID=A0A0C9VM38_SPHS4|nr:hypothetical protein M422DRAFT_32983 [Sphaerobolus stellatus SS14]
MASHTKTPSKATDGDPENPQSMVIASLRSQVSDLLTQVTQLNGKLVQSYDRISDLEDNLHMTESAQRAATLKISALELERTEHLAALNTGLLVEKANVTSELNRLMERATEEAAKRGIAESAKQEIESDLDDLSAELFARANSMVVEARLAQARSERRVQEAEAGLKGAEEAVRAMQEHMQALRDEKERANRAMDKGKWVTKPGSIERPMRLLNTHAPYMEFIAFVSHLRQLRPTTPQPPPIASLLPLPFIARLIAEDSDPTLRLDAAPALNWLTRRTVTAAIHASQLTVEPVPISALSAQYPDLHAATCALCGRHVLSSSSSSPSPPPYTATPAQVLSTAISATSWRPSFLKSASPSSPPPLPVRNHSSQHIHSPTPSIATSGSFYPPSTSTPPPTPPLPSTELPRLHGDEPETIYVFRLQTQTPSTLSTPTHQSFAHPHMSSTSTSLVTPSRTPTLSSSTSQSSMVYPLCTSGWCLARLRTTCELWRFIRVGIVSSVWEEEVSPTPITSPPNVNGSILSSITSSSKPPVPPRRRGLNIGVGKLFGMATNALSSKATSATSPLKSPAAPPAPSKDKSTLTPPPPLPRRNDNRDKMREARANRERAASLAQQNEPEPEKVVESESPVKEEEELAPAPAPAPADTPTSTDPVQTALPRSPVEMIFDHDEEHEREERSKVEKMKVEESVVEEKKDGDEKVEETKKEDQVEQEEKEDTLDQNENGEDKESEEEKKEEDKEDKEEQKENKRDSVVIPSTPTKPKRDSITASAIPSTPTKRDSIIPSTPTKRDSITIPSTPTALGDHETRTGSPAPPPVPRRAARRAAPVPPGSPAPMETKPADAAKDAAPKPETSKEGEAEAPGEKDADAEVSKVEVVETESQAEPMTVSQEVSAEASKVESQAEPVSQEVVAEEDEEKTDETQVLAATSIPPSLPARRPVPPPLPARERQSPEEIQSLSVKSAETTFSNDENPGQYVGDATWEERTWRNLTRLREDMFYARIGCVR